MNAVKWVLIDDTKGAKTKKGAALSPTALGNIAEAVQSQVNGEFAAEWGARTTIRVGEQLKDVKPDEWAYLFVSSLPDDPDASAYHDITKKGIPVAFCAVTTCDDLYGPNGISVDASHEILETAGDEGANQYANDNKGALHAVEMCDAVEVQTYGKPCKDGSVLEVSNWLLRSWFIPDAPGPYDYMTFAKLPGAVAPMGPLTTAHGDNGNYQIISRWGGAHQVFAAAHHIVGNRRKGMKPHWASRTARRLKQLAQAYGS
jgi:hypothetical protein